MAALPLQISKSCNSLCFDSRSRGGAPGILLARANKIGRVSSTRTNESAYRPIVCLRGGGPPQTQRETGPQVIFGRHSFPPEFTFGAASSAYQIEGGWNEGGRGPSIWDTFTQQHPEKIDGRSNGNVAVDSYHRYKEDVKLLKDMNMDAYRFSISWSRILPSGSLDGGINQKGIDYYNKLINECLANGITPYVTLFHWDLPQALQDKYDGFMDKRVKNDFRDYCDVCFNAFGDRVKHWITLNEPWSFASMGYSLGKHAPGRCSPALNCPSGNSLVEPYIVTHNLLLAHGEAAKLYKEKYQAQQRGTIGITLVCMWYTPYETADHHHVEAANRALDFMLAWYMEPLVHGDYPFSMKALVRERLPTFTKEEAEMIKGSYDFIGINYYTARYARSLPFSHDQLPWVHINESYAEQLEGKDGVPIGETNGSWIYVYPSGIRHLVTYIKNRYANPAIYITENGYSEVDHGEMTKEEAIADEERKNYLQVHLAEVRDAIREGANVKGYFAWTLTDNFEWEKGYTERFGLHYVDYSNLQRHQKDSAKWFSKFLETDPRSSTNNAPKTSIPFPQR